MQTHDDVVDRQFGPRANAYVASPTHAGGPDLDRIETIARAFPHAKVLDLGCGGGHVAYRAAPHVAEVIACDLSPQMLNAVEAEATRRGIGNLTTRQAAAEALPFAHASFDLLLCRFTAHHWHDLDAGLREARRVLKPGGRAVFSDVVAPAHPLLDTHLQAVELLRDTSHVRDYRIDEWQAALGRAGFTIDAVATHRLAMEFASWVARMHTPEPHIIAIRALQRAASEGVKRGFEIADDGSFMVDVALFEARA
ncbi:Methyltransferase domain-containing protein [Sphingomonas sp. YR710]|uniref:class I SAM-dependent methyltransferase n=1 Tax=Sphingomonas sp. YR710 TaxID=1882773 RepID=UPI00088F32DD|nr:class I SAM-dependent methyltransferase [Sphingomonas sp. YR710]SDC88347.1 Methyltransferase domain-containing protein [Sphingomonas sp. YR710]